MNFLHMANGCLESLQNVHGLSSFVFSLSVLVELEYCLVFSFGDMFSTAVVPNEAFKLVFPEVDCRLSSDRKASRPYIGSVAFFASCFTKVTKSLNVTIPPYDRMFKTKQYSRIF